MAKAREVELSRAIKAPRAQVNATKDQALVASTCVLSLEEERWRMIAPSLDELRIEADGCL